MLTTTIQIGQRTLAVSLVDFISLTNAALKDDDGEEFCSLLRIYYYHAKKIELEELTAERFYETFRANLKATPEGNRFVYNSPPVTLMDVKTLMPEPNLNWVAGELEHFNAVDHAPVVGIRTAIYAEGGVEVVKFMNPIVTLTCSNIGVANFRNRQELNLFIQNLLKTADAAWGADAGFNESTS